MRQYYILLLLWALPLSITLGQNAQIDSLRHLLSQTRQDTNQVLILTELADNYSRYSPDSSLKLAQQALSLTHNLRFAKGEAKVFQIFCTVFRVNGDFPQALAYGFKALVLHKTLHNEDGEAWAQNLIGITYFDLGEIRKALDHYQQAGQTFKVLSDEVGTGTVLNNMTNAYISLQLLDSARIVNQRAHQWIKRIPGNSLQKRVLCLYSGRLAFLAGNFVKALHFYQQALALGILSDDIRIQSTTQLNIAELFSQFHQPDSSLHYAHLALNNSHRLNYKTNVLRATNLLAQLYKSANNSDSALYYQEIARAVNDSLYGPKKFHQLQLLLLTEQQRQQELEATQNDYQNKVRVYSLLSGLGVVLLLAFVLYRSNRRQQRVNGLLHRQKEEIDLQRAKAEQALAELKSTQTQLIQREKLASLGELTAGIAHEIQNPLNFVNNFSELSAELVEELKEEAQSGQIDEVLGIADDLTQNLQKITHHGQRASSIVKGMLEHSRTSSGQKEPTDINALADEYLRLAYQGQRSKDQTLNCKLITDFAANLPPVHIVPQEIGRVLLNLFNNAFYAVLHKQKTAPADYLPAVTVSTVLLPLLAGEGRGERVNASIQIQVCDNGPGIADPIKDKIFQPFFTTKPTGEGTGLGLSLSYDIVTKGHNGTMAVESQPGDHALFVITLPISKPV
ncbi:tetratricopeptide repeat-containing sensor histidine kinase [Spirosoma gilvum]